MGTSTVGAILMKLKICWNKFQFTEKIGCKFHAVWRLNSPRKGTTWNVKNQKWRRVLSFKPKVAVICRQFFRNTKIFFLCFQEIFCLKYLSINLIAICSNSGRFLWIINKTQKTRKKGTIYHQDDSGSDSVHLFHLKWKQSGITCNNAIEDMTLDIHFEPPISPRLNDPSLDTTNRGPLT